MKQRTLSRYSLEKTKHVHLNFVAMDTGVVGLLGYEGFWGKLHVNMKP
jgi:hypothetical protein